MPLLPSFVGKQTGRANQNVTLPAPSAAGAVAGDMQVLYVSSYLTATHTVDASWAIISTNKAAAQLHLAVYKRTLTEANLAAGVAVNTSVVGEPVGAEVRTYRDATDVVARGFGLGSAAPARAVESGILARSWAGGGDAAETLGADAALLNRTAEYSFTWWGGLAIGDDPAAPGATAPARTATGGDQQRIWTDVEVLGQVATDDLVTRIDAGFQRVSQEFNAIRGTLGTPQLRKPEVVASLTGTGQPTGWTTPANVRSTDTCIVILSCTQTTSFVPDSGWNVLGNDLRNTNYYGHSTYIVARPVGAAPSTNVGTLPTTGSTPETAAWTVLYIRNAGNFYGSTSGAADRNNNAAPVPEYDPPGAVLAVHYGTMLGNNQSISAFGAPYIEGQAARYFAGANATWIHRWGLTDERATARSLTPTSSFDRNLWSIRMSGVPADGFVLDELVDVDTAATAPRTGDVLVYDSTTGKWRPGKGGPEVGAWENNLTTNFQYPAPVEYDLQANPTPWGTTRTTVAQMEVTLTAGDLPVNTGASIGNRWVVQIMALGRAIASNAGTITMEASTFNAAQGTETNHNSTNVSGPALNSRVSLTMVSAAMVVGDKARLRFWTNTTAGAVVTDWWAYRVLPTHLGCGRDAGRIGLFRDIKRLGTLNAGFTPTTVLTQGATAALNTWTRGQKATESQWMDNGEQIGVNTNPTTTRTLLADPTGADRGIMTLSDGFSGASYTAGQSTTASANLHYVEMAANFEVDRLWVPAPPA